MSVYELHRGSSPVILGLPHTGTDVPTDIWARLNDNGRLLADTDWHIHRLYEGLVDGVTTVRATFHRYVIDANRDPAGVSLYPGQNTTGLIPQTDFDGQPIWKEGAEPTEADMASRLETCHRPYHEALSAEIERVKALHGYAVLYDCHSIRPVIPFLFDGVLPDFNIGTDDSRSCDVAVERAAVEAAAEATGYTSILNGRFKGGWTTRHYAGPGVQSIQMELAQSTHLAELVPPFAYDEAKAEQLRRHLSRILSRIAEAARSLNEKGKS